MNTDTNTHRRKAPSISYSFATGASTPQVNSYRGALFALRRQLSRNKNFGFDRFTTHPDESAFSTKTRNRQDIRHSPALRGIVLVDDVSVTSPGNFAFDISQIIVF
ncbi:hypothetical protein FPJ27_13210 [Burkholderia sp. MS455]|uniref:hypothetical protein n=1 Tax=Burkholderia sp. MS455 TaxID=2811788 RepID=UPI001956D841|nr:hypothetical protein [Burkholderia sp. MS455]QRR07288.1 hypothetical protein FPJ27_13210 [Burkholderia sp. MS455]